MKYHADVEPDNSPLSKKENQILGLMAEGLTRVEIAEYLHRSMSTVNTHFMHILQKLDANNRSQAISIAVIKGILSFSKTGCLLLAIAVGVNAVFIDDGYADVFSCDGLGEQVVILVRDQARGRDD